MALGLLLGCSCGVVSLDCDGVYQGISACLTTAKLGGAGIVDLAERTADECRQVNKTGKATAQDVKRYNCFQKLTDTQCASPTVASTSLGNCANP